jgi:TolA-binding protein
VQAAPAKAEPPSEPPLTITLNPPPNPTPPVVVRPPAPTEPLILTEAEDKFAIGNYSGAIQDYEKFLHDYPVHKDVPQASFRLGLAYALSGPSAQNQRKALEVLRSVVKDHPFNPYRVPSEYILSLLAEIERLKTENDAKEDSIKRLKEELERIKKIDMERRPTKPPR